MLERRRILLSTQRGRTKSDLKVMYSLLNAAAHTAPGHGELSEILMACPYEELR